MSSFSTILVPLDMSAEDRSIRAAADLAAAFDGSVILLHVVEELDAPADELTDFYTNLETHAQRHLERAAGALRKAGIPHRTEVRFGKRAAEIIAFSDEHDVDLIVLASHRLDPNDLSRSIMTISHQIAIAGRTSVLLVR